MTSRQSDKDRELRGAIAYLETLLRSTLGLPDPTLIRSGQIADAARRFILENPILRRYIDTAQHGSRGDDRPNPWMVLALAKSELAQGRALKRKLFKIFGGDGSREAGLRSLVFTAIVGIAVAAATSLFNTQSEIQAKRAEEVYAGRRQFLEETINKLTQAQSQGQALRRDLRQSEAGGELHPEDTVFHRESLRELQLELRRIMAALQADPGSDLRYAELRAWFELEALDACLANSDSLRLEEAIRAVEKRGDISSRQAEQILSGASADAPCGKEFHPEVLEDFTFQVANWMWNLSDDLKD